MAVFTVAAQSLMQGNRLMIGIAGVIQATFGEVRNVQKCRPWRRQGNLKLFAKHHRVRHASGKNAVRTVHATPAKAEIIGLCHGAPPFSFCVSVTGMNPHVAKKMGVNKKPDGCSGRMSADRLRLWLIGRAHFRTPFEQVSCRDPQVVRIIPPRKPLIMISVELQIVNR